MELVFEPGFTVQNNCINANEKSLFLYLVNLTYLRSSRSIARQGTDLSILPCSWQIYQLPSTLTFPSHFSLSLSVSFSAIFLQVSLGLQSLFCLPSDAKLRAIFWPSLFPFLSLGHAQLWLTPRKPLRSQPLIRDFSA